MTMHNDFNDYATVSTMADEGNHFEQAIARAALLANYDNLLKMKATWPEIFEKYRILSGCHP